MKEIVASAAAGGNGNVPCPLFFSFSASETTAGQSPWRLQLDASPLSIHRCFLSAVRAALPAGCSSEFYGAGRISQSVTVLSAPPEASVLPSGLSAML